MKHMKKDLSRFVFSMVSVVIFLGIIISSNSQM
jgi:hypothetical protein